MDNFFKFPKLINLLEIDLLFLKCHFKASICYGIKALPSSFLLPYLDSWNKFIRIGFSFENLRIPTIQTYESSTIIAHH
jgi:hypothetical protein